MNHYHIEGVIFHPPKGEGGYEFRLDLHPYPRYKHAMEAIGRMGRQLTGTGAVEADFFFRILSCRRPECAAPASPLLEPVEAEA